MIAVQDRERFPKEGTCQTRLGRKGHSAFGKMAVSSLDLFLIHGGPISSVTAQGAVCRQAEGESDFSPGHEKDTNAILAQKRQIAQHVSYE